MANGTIYRKAIWLMRGLREFTKDGFIRASQSFRPKDLEEKLDGHSFMVTGANSGIGKVTALELAKRGATVHMVCRNQARGESAKEDIERSTSSRNIHLHILDISRPKDVLQFTKNFRDQGHSLDVLVNNAGCMVLQRELTEEGLEKNFATNTLGAYILTSELLPVLEQSPHGPPRVITVSSGGMYLMKLDPNDLQFEQYQNFDGTYAYAQNKRQQVVMTKRWARQYQDRVRFFSMHPGWADTPAVSTSMPDFHQRFEGKLRTPEQGADTVLYLCIAESVNDLPNGEFFQDRRIASQHLPLAWTTSTDGEEELLMTNLEAQKERFRNEN